MGTIECLSCAACLVSEQIRNVNKNMWNQFMVNAQIEVKVFIFHATEIQAIISFHFIVFTDAVEVSKGDHA